MPSHSVVIAVLLMAHRDLPVGADTVKVRATQAAWGDSVSLVREATFGTLDGPPEYMLGRIGQGVATRDGKLFLFDESDLQIRRYDSSGKFVGKVGRKGAGPGEYASVEALAMLGDSLLLVLDLSNGRLDVFDTAGAARPTIRIDVGKIFYPEMGITLLTDTGGMVYLRWTKTQSEGQAEPSRIVRLSLPDRVVDRFDVPAETGDPRAYEKQFLLILGDDGDRMNFPIQTFSAPWAGGGVVIAKNDAYRFSIISKRRVIEVTRPHRRIRLETEERAEWMAFAPAIPTLKPVFRNVFSDPEGRLWFHLYVAAKKRPDRAGAGKGSGVKMSYREPNVYEAFTGEGQLLGRITLPLRARLLTLRGQKIWTLEEGTDGQPVVARYRIEPGS